jgi:16S rRNA (cytosine1402-N4)-methyltransferase
MNTGEIHIPVMLDEVIDHLNIKKNGFYVDCTFGNGGHSKAILEKLESGKLVALEWDKNSVELIQGNNLFSPPKFYLINDNFANLEECLKDFNAKEIDGFLFDLGLSS